MVRTLAHRGPDRESICVIPEASPRAGLGVRRLAIVDPAAGHQPVTSADGRITVCLNGEIYNHDRLRRELQARRVPFRTRGDAEVAANLIARVGLRPALRQMVGMFALAVVDSAARRLWLVRDRMGVKPLVWTRLPDGAVAWGSELRALLAHPAIQRRPDRRALQAYLLLEYIPSPWTPWRDISQLDPGALLEIDEGGVRGERWWSPPLPRPGRGGDRARWASSLHAALQVATRQRLAADVEVGALLSGGIDSSTVAALASAESGFSSGGPLQTFSVAVDAPGFDESTQARRVAAALGTAHREARLVSDDLPRLLDEISAHMDTPLADSSLIATWRLMELVTEAGVRCVLSGDGADETLAGYPTYVAHRLAPLARPFRGVLGSVSGRLPTTHGGVTRDYMARRFALGLAEPSWARRHQVWMGAWLPQEIGAGEDVWACVDPIAAELEGADSVSRAMVLDQRRYLADGVLAKVDRASMAMGIEVRSPFMDHRVVELAASMPRAIKLRGRTGKAVLRDAMAGELPGEVLRRPKKGFGSPVGPWLRGPCRHLLVGLESQLDDLIPGDLIRRCIDEHLRGVRDHRRRLWSAIVLARWRAGPWG